RLANCPFTEEEADWILKLSGRHPFFIQRVCYHLFEEKSLHREVNKRRAAKQAYDELFPHFEYLWNETNPEQHTLLMEEAQRKGVLERQIPELSESSLFRKFVRDICQLKFAHLDRNELIEELRTLVKHLDKPEFLGNSKLRHLKLVATRLQYKDTPSTFEKGIAVREVLYEALEKMRGPGMRVDFAHAWRSYNVLHYTYFKKIHANQSQIASRVGVSYRHYHRVKDEAIETLTDRLIEMEAACNLEDEE